MGGKAWYEIDEDELTLVIWQVMDDTTHDLCIAKDMEQYTTPYEKISKFILGQIRQSEERGVLRERHPAKSKDGDVPMYAMNRQYPEQPTTSEEESPDGNDEWDDHYTS